MYSSYFSRMGRQFSALKTKFKQLPSGKRKTTALFAVLAVIAVFLLSAYISGMVVSPVMKLLMPNEEVVGPLQYGIKNPIGLMLTLFILFLFFGMIIGQLGKLQISNAVMYTTPEGVTIMQNPEQGSGREMLTDEIKEVFNVKDIVDTKEIVYGQLTEDGKQTVSFKPKKYGSSGNKNLLLLGSPGTGKSYCFVRTNILQAMLRGDSIVATDPSGELYTSLGQTLRDNGYDVRILNLVEPRYSDFWNCMDEVIDPETGRLDGTRLNEFTEIYVRNSSDSNTKEDYWYKGTTNLLRAAIGHASWQRECDILNHYKELYAKVATPGGEKDTVLNSKMKDMVPFTWCEELIMKEALKNGYDEEEIKQKFEQIKKSAPPFTIKEVFNDIMNFPAIIGDFDNIPISHPGRQAYIIFSSAKDQVQGQVINGTQLSMQLFADQKLSTVLSHDGISIPEVNMKKCAYFVIMSDKASATTPIASLFFSFFFKDAQENWDKYSKLAEEDGIPNPCLDTFVMLDEFFSIGVIGGNPKSFAKTISVNRKRHISINIAVQSITQLQELYGQENANSIQTCCDYIMFLGCNDPKTAEFISNFVAGEGTVLSESHQESTNVLSSAGDDAKITIKSAKRKILTVDEARRWKDNVLLCKRGEHYAKLKPFPWTLHPCYVNGETRVVSVYKALRPIEDRALELEGEEQSSDKKYAEVSKQINSIQSKYSKNMPKQDAPVQTSLPIENEEKIKKDSKKFSNKSSQKNIGKKSDDGDMLL